MAVAAVVQSITTTNKLWIRQAPIEKYDLTILLDQWKSWRFMCDGVEVVYTPQEVFAALQKEAK